MFAEVNKEVDILLEKRRGYDTSDVDLIMLDMCNLNIKGYTEILLV